MDLDKLLGEYSKTGNTSIKAKTPFLDEDIFRRKCVSILERNSENNFLLDLMKMDVEDLLDFDENSGIAEIPKRNRKSHKFLEGRIGTLAASLDSDIVKMNNQLKEISDKKEKINEYTEGMLENMKDFVKNCYYNKQCEIELRKFGKREKSENQHLLDFEKAKAIVKVQEREICDIKFFVDKKKSIEKKNRINKIKSKFEAKKEKMKRIEKELKQLEFLCIDKYEMKGDSFHFSFKGDNEIFKISPTGSMGKSSRTEKFRITKEKSNNEKEYWYKVLNIEELCGFLMEINCKKNKEESSKSI